MKIQCSCGSKYVIEVSAEMAGKPVQFVCPVCGRDSSEYVTQLVQQELGTVAGQSAAQSPASASAPAPPGPVRLQLHPAGCRFVNLSLLLWKARLPQMTGRKGARNIRPI